jgi:hypothetical protein
MIRISEALRHTIAGNPFLEFGIHHGLFNLTQLARYLGPLVQARTRKEVQTSAITMNLSRLQQELRATAPRPEQYVIENVTIHSGLCTVTYPKSPEIHAKLHALYNRIHAENGFCSLAQGLHEATVIIESRFRSWLKGEVKQKPLYEHADLSSVGVQFSERYADIPGMLYMLLQRVALQNVNLIEITSTYTEIVFYIDQRDTQTVFDTFFESFLVKSGGGRR